MRPLLLLAALLCAAPAPAAVLGHTWRESKLTVALDDGSIEIEWLSPVAFRYARYWTAPPAARWTLDHDPVLIALDAGANRYKMQSRQIAVELDPEQNTLTVRAGNNSIATLRMLRAASIELHLDPWNKFFGDPAGLFFSDKGYGLALRPGTLGQFAAATVRLPARDSLEFAFFSGPAPKDLLEQYQVISDLPEVPVERTVVRAKDGAPGTLVPDKPLRDWTDFAAAVDALQKISLAGGLYPSFDLASIAAAPEELRQRALDFASVLPFVSGTRPRLDAAVRRALTPYFTTYLREGWERGFPPIRSFLMQFPKDAGSDSHPQEFMLGDEFLIAPVLAPGTRRSIRLPRGVWTDLRTNTLYRGNQSIEIDAPPGRVPMFARNGSLFPWATGQRMELHYVPSLGGEFFLWEPALKKYTQFHAAPAGDLIRVEIETKVERTYEWVLHHTPVPQTVSEEGSAPYRRVDRRTALRAGTWWHDDERNNLHLMLHAGAGSDRIVNITGTNPEE